MSVLEIIPTKRDATIFHLKCTNDKVMEYFKQKIDENTGPEDYKTNVQGKMTEYAFFLKDPTFINFMNKKFMKEMQKFSQIFPTAKSLVGETRIVDAWGNKLEKGGEVIPHEHTLSNWSTVLYFCDSAPLETEIGTFKTFKGKIITIPGWLRHWVSPVNCKERYNLVWNWNYSLVTKKELSKTETESMMSNYNLVKKEKTGEKNE